MRFCLKKTRWTLSCGLSVKLLSLQGLDFWISLRSDQILPCWYRLSSNAIPILYAQPDSLRTAPYRVGPDLQEGSGQISLRVNFLRKKKVEKEFCRDDWRWGYLGIIATGIFLLQINVTTNYTNNNSKVIISTIITIFLNCNNLYKRTRAIGTLAMLWNC